MLNTSAETKDDDSQLITKLTHCLNDTIYEHEHSAFTTTEISQLIDKFSQYYLQSITLLQCNKFDEFLQHTISCSYLYFITLYHKKQTLAIICSLRLFHDEFMQVIHQTTKINASNISNQLSDEQIKFYLCVYTYTNSWRCELEEKQQLYSFAKATIFLPFIIALLPITYEKMKALKMENENFTLANQHSQLLHSHLENSMNFAENEIYEELHCRVSTIRNRLSKYTGWLARILGLSAKEKVASLTLLLNIITSKLSLHDINDHINDLLQQANFIRPRHWLANCCFFRKPSQPPKSVRELKTIQEEILYKRPNTVGIMHALGWYT